MTARRMAVMRLAASAVIALLAAATPAALAQTAGQTNIRTADWLRQGSSKAEVA